MAFSDRARRVSGLLNEKVKASIIGVDSRKFSNVSSGSEHDDSPCLSDLIHDFLDEQEVTDMDSIEDNELEETWPDSEQVESTINTRKLIRNILNPCNTISDAHKTLLVSQVSKGTEIFSCLRSNKSMFLRNVVQYLRNSGHNASVCKTKWESSGGLTSGSYEFIDIESSTQCTTSCTRYIVELDFPGEFSIARPTENYSSLLNELTEVFVGREEEMKKIVKVMSGAAKRSLKKTKLLLPPWRKNRYMQMKWFGPYKRIINLAPLNSPFQGSQMAKSTVKCRAVGFYPSSDVNGSFVVRTR